MLKHSSNHCVYVLIDPRNGYQVFYVGKTREDRTQQTINRHKTNTANTWKFNKIASMDRSGTQPILHLIRVGLTEEKAFLLEIKLIAALRKLGFQLVNATAGGEGTSGYRHSSEVCKLRSHRMKANNPMKKLGAKMKLASFKSKPVSQYTLDGVLVAQYPSAKVAALQNGVFRQNIAACCAKKTSHANGFVWRYSNVS